MAAANIRFRSEYHNTSGVPTVYKIEILDTHPVAQIINFESTEPQIQFEGLSQELKPGVYPTFLRFGFYIRERPRASGGKTYGPSDSFINHLFTSPEGRFLARIFKDDSLYFIGILMPDECSFEDSPEPYLLNVTIGDALYRWRGKRYSSLFGTLAYKTIKKHDPGDVIITTPLPMPPEFGTEWVMINHLSQFYVVHGENWGTDRSTTFARREQYATVSPGVGWVLQDNSLWAKQITYTNEVITDHPPLRYTIRRNIVNSTHRILTDLISEAMFTLGLSEEYPGIMWDNSTEWYEHHMANFIDDAFSMIRLPEEEFNTMEVDKVVVEICKLFFLRVYYSKGRYHWEQISYRDTVPFKRFTYLPDGTYTTTEAVTLDVIIEDEDIHPEIGGSYKIMAPLKTVEVSIDLTDGNLLEGEYWKNDRIGDRYIGRIGRAEGIEVLKLELTNKMNTRFDSATMATLPPTTQLISVPHDWMILTSLRIVDTETGATYYLTGDASVTDTTTSDKATWEAAAYDFEKRNRINFAFNPNSQDPALDYSKIVVNTFLSENLPGAEGATYDLFLSINYYIAYVNPMGVLTWIILNPDKVLYTFFAEGKINFFDDADPPNEVNGQAQRIYAVDNDINNSIVIQNKVLFADTGRQSQSIEIYNGTGWIKSVEWSRGGVAEVGEPLLSLLAKEIMSLRITAKRLYNGNFISPIINNEDRIRRLTLYYLPLNVSKSTGVDDFSGEFFEIARTVPPDVTLIEKPFDESNDPPILGDPVDNGSGGADPIPVTFETDAVIVDESTISQVAIVNTSGVFVQAGTHVQIMHPTTGVFEIVVLTQDILANDTIMYFTAHHFVNGYPDASFVIPQMDDGHYPTSLAQVYYFYKKPYSAIEIYAPNFTFVDPEKVGLHDINKRYKLFRNQLRIYCKFGASTPFEKISSYYFNNITHKWHFYDEGLVNEEIEIEAF